MSMFPYDINELADGPVRCMFAPITADLPAKLADIHDQVDPYEPVGTDETDTWIDFGATAGPFQTSRNLTTAAYRIQQSRAAVRERVTEVVRTVVVNVAELRPEIVKMLEEAPAVTDHVSAAGSGAHSKVAFGNIEDLTQYRMAFIARRGKDQGIVTEPTTSKKRGRHFAFVAYRAQISADNLQWSFAEGDLASANVTFRLFPEAGQPENQEHGLWLFEDAGTFAA